MVENLFKLLDILLPGTIGSRTNSQDASGTTDSNEQNSNSFTCLVCCIPFCSKIEILRHLSKIHRLTNLCRICYFDLKKIERFANPVSLRNHNLKCHSEKMVKCVCGSMLINSKMLMSHLKKFKCDVNSNETNNNTMVKCICGKRFSSQEQIVLHQSKCRKRERCDMILDSSPSVSVSNIQYQQLHTQNYSNYETHCKGKSSLKFSTNKLSFDSLSVQCSPVRGGRKSNRRKSKENVQYDVEKFDEIFRKAIVTSLYTNTPYSMLETVPTSIESGLPGNKNIGGQRSSTVTLEKVEPMSDSEEKELDLRTASVKNRNSNTTSTSCVTEVVDCNNNISDVSPKVLQEYSCTSVSTDKNDASEMLEQNSSDNEMKDNNNNDTSLAKETCDNSASKEKNDDLISDNTKAFNETKHSNMRLAKLKEMIKRKRRKSINTKTDVKRKYACKVCRRLYPRPYLYSHQKLVHNKTNWILVPMPTTMSKPGNFCILTY